MNILSRFSEMGLKPPIPQLRLQGRALYRFMSISCSIVYQYVQIQIKSLQNSNLVRIFHLYYWRVLMVSTTVVSMCFSFHQNNEFQNCNLTKIQRLASKINFKGEKIHDTLQRFKWPYKTEEMRENTSTRLRNL